MYGTSGLISSLLGAYHMSEVSMRYSRFMPRAYNLAKSLGFKRGKIMPSRAFRTIVQEPSYREKKILFISGLNVDISPREGQVFPLTKFIPWAAYVQDEHGNHQTWEQAELYAQLQAQSTKNPDQVDLETAIEMMERAKEIQLPF
jgi:hypothetical protein